jgi:hypothetical protein
VRNIAVVEKLDELHNDKEKTSVRFAAVSDLECPILNRKRMYYFYFILLRLSGNIEDASERNTHSQARYRLDLCLDYHVTLLTGRATLENVRDFQGVYELIGP